MTDPIADFLTRIRNGQRAERQTVDAPYSRLKEAIARILVQEGYLAGYEVEGEKVKTLRVTLKYQGRKGVIEGLQRVSKPGLRRYAKAAEAPRVLGGLGVAILSTSRGVMTDRQARKANVGGEVLCYVW
ncbi:MAG: 30S ribosomal protein S8 [Verrucomicrobia bacterium]|nr:30S ribosomal protein S8 [Verrucomicrobiota bacterium]